MCRQVLPKRWTCQRLGQMATRSTTPSGSAQLLPLQRRVLQKGPPRIGEVAASATMGAAGYITVEVEPWASKRPIGRLTVWPADNPPRAAIGRMPMLHASELQLQPQTAASRRLAFFALVVFHATAANRRIGCREGRRQSRARRLGADDACGGPPASGAMSRDNRARYLAGLCASNEVFGNTQCQPSLHSRGRHPDR